MSSAGLPRGRMRSYRHTLVRLNRSPSVVRSTSVIVLSRLVALRTLPLLRTAADPRPGRSQMAAPQD